MKTIITTALICMSLQGLSQSTDPYQKVDLKLPETNKQLSDVGKGFMFTGAFFMGVMAGTMTDNFDKKAPNGWLFATGMAIHATGMVIYINSRK